MKLFDKLFGKKEKVVEEVKKEPANKYYMGNNKFGFNESTIPEIITLTVKKGFEEFPDLYECTIEYNYRGPAQCIEQESIKALIGYETIIVGFNLEEMISNSKYAEQVFLHLLRENRVIELHDVEFDVMTKEEKEEKHISEGFKPSNYVGTIPKGTEDANSLTSLFDDNALNFVRSLPSTKEMHDRYDAERNADIDRMIEFNLRAEEIAKDRMERGKADAEATNDYISRLQEERSKLLESKREEDTPKLNR